MISRLRQLLPKVSERTSLATTGAEDDHLPLAVLEFQSPTAAVLAMQLPASARWTNWLLTAFLLLVLFVAWLVPVEKLVTCTGELVSQAPDIVVQNFNSTAILTNMRVKQGDFVHRGQVLATIDPTTTNADFTALTQQVQAYSAQVAQLQAQENGKPYVPDPTNPASALQFQTYNQMVGQYNAQMQSYAQQINQLQAEIDGANNQAAVFRQRLAIASNVQDIYTKAEQMQVGSELNKLSSADNTEGMRASVEQNESTAQSTQKQLNGVKATEQGYDQQWKAQISTQLATAINSLTQARDQLAKAQLNNQFVTLVAPQDAIVQSVAPVSVGGVMQAGQSLVDLTPANAPFEVQADIDSNISGYARVGDQATIKFTTLDSLLFGEAHGTVTDISVGSFNPGDTMAVQSQMQSAPLPGTPQNLYYQATVSVDTIGLHNVPDGFRLVPGMPVEVDIIVGRRSILDFFLTKMEPMLFQSMHEP